jgi:small subunit ribosomal protein S19
VKSRGAGFQPAAFCKKWQFENLPHEKTTAAEECWMSRSLKKGPYVDERLLARVERQQTGHREPLKTWSRDCTIVPDFIGHTFLIHNGKMFIKLFVTEDMIGHKLGEFAPTRMFRGHSGGKAKAAAAAGPGKG